MENKMPDSEEEMNDKIQELMNKTGVPVSMPFDAWCEKFAELIIRECIRTVARQELMSHPEYEWTEREIGYNDAINTVKNVLKMQYGVK
jgi:hypothetical protein